MWLLFGIVAIMTAILNMAFGLGGKKNSKWFGFTSLSSTALTVCAFYSDAAHRVIKEDWAGLLDILPPVSKFLWVCVISSILINLFPMVLKKRSEISETETHEVE